MFSLSNLLPAQDTWETVETMEGGFYVQCPGTMDEQEQIIETDIGEVVMRTYVHQPAEEEAENSVFLLSYCDYPSQTVHEDSLDLIDPFFQATIEEAVSSLQGELMYTDSTDWRGHPSRFWRVDYLQQQAVMKTRAILVGNRLFLLQVAARRAKAINPASERFFDSFKLLVE